MFKKFMMYYVWLQNIKITKNKYTKLDNNKKKKN